MYIQLMIKGTVADAEAKLDEIGFGPDDRLTPVTQEKAFNLVYTTVQVALECEPGVQRWIKALESPPPFPPGTLLAYTIAREPEPELLRDFDAALQAFMAAAQLKIDAHYPDIPKPSRSLTLLINSGARYVRLYNDNGVYCFVDRDNGNVLKAKTWKAPDLKNPRSNIYDDDHGAKGVDWHGAVYLR